MKSAHVGGCLPAVTDTDAFPAPRTATRSKGAGWHFAGRSAGRYNTLDLASKVVWQGVPCTPLRAACVCFRNRNQPSHRQAAFAIAKATSLCQRTANAALLPCRKLHGNPPRAGFIFAQSTLVLYLLCKFNTLYLTARTFVVPF